MAVPVHAASGFEQRVTEAPSAVSILTRDDLRGFSYRTLADALSGLVGFYTTHDRSYHTLGVRGFNRPGDYNTRTLVLINGVTINDPLYSTGRVGTDFPLDLDLIERVEVVRGPSSSLYGSSAFFAVINVVTRDAQSVAPAEGAVSAGSFYAFTGRFSAAHTFGDKGSLLLSGSLAASEGDDLYFPAFDDTAEGLDGEWLGSFFLQGRYGNWTLQAVHADRVKDRPTASFGTIFNDADAWDRDQETLVDVSWAGEIAEHWSGQARAGYQRYAYKADWPFDYAEEGEPEDRVVDRDLALAETIGGEARVSTTILPRQKVTVGAEVRHSFRLNQRYQSGDDIVLDSREDQTYFGLYAQDEMRLASWALVNAGVRYDRREPYGAAAVSPRTALILAPLDCTVVKLIYGAAFRAPNVYERFYDDGGYSLKANPDLDSETIRTYELVWEQRVATWFRLMTSLYRYDVKNLISQTEDPDDGLLVFRNLEKVKAQGVEIEGRLDLPGGVRARIGYNWSDTENRETGARLSNSPEHMVGINLLAPVVTPRLTAGVEVQYIGDRRTVSGEQLGGFTVANATLRARRLPGDFEVLFSVYNLYDKAYVHAVSKDIEGGTVAQDGRTFRVKAMKRF